MPALEPVGVNLERRRSKVVTSSPNSATATPLRTPAVSDVPVTTSQNIGIAPSSTATIGETTATEETAKPRYKSPSAHPLATPDAQPKT